MIVIVDTDAEFVSWASDALADIGDRLLTDDLVDALAAIEAGDAETIVLGPSTPLDETCHAVERIVDADPEIAVITVLPDSTAAAIQAVVRAGARDVLTRPLEEDDLRTAIKRAQDLSRQLRERHGSQPATVSAAPTGQVDSRTITIFSTKGGSGKSLIATNLALALHSDDDPTALVDLDLQSGDQAILLQLQPSRGIFEASESIDRLDSEALDGYLTTHRTGLDVLTGPLEPSLAESISGPAVTRMLEMLRSTHRYTIVDGPAFFSDPVLSAFDLSDIIVLVASLDIPSVKNLRLALSTLHQLGIGRDRLRIVLNRADSKVGLKIGDVEKSLGTDVDISIPSSRDVPLSVNEGKPLVLHAKGSPVSAAIRELADSLRLPGHTEATEPSSSPSALRRLLARA